MGNYVDLNFSKVLSHKDLSSFMHEENSRDF